MIEAESLGVAYPTGAKAHDHEHLLDEIVRQGLASEVTEPVQANPAAEASTELSLCLAVGGSPYTPDELGIQDPLRIHDHPEPGTPMGVSAKISCNGERYGHTSSQERIGT